MSKFINQREIVPPKELLKFNCEDCDGEVWQLEDTISNETIKSCSCGHYEAKEKPYLKPSSDKKPEKIGNISI